MTEQDLNSVMDKKEQHIEIKSIDYINISEKYSTHFYIEKKSRSG